MTQQWLMSFTDPSIPPADPPVPGGPSYLGGCVVEAEDLASAIMRAWEVGANPGGNVLALNLPAGSIDAKWMDRLLTKDEVMSIPEPKQ